jgi:hypothetical protein
VGQVARRIRVLRQGALTAAPRSGIGP